MAITIRDSVHGSIRIHDWAQNIIAHPVFQRLRRVRQLGTAYLVYPGANHTRFEHSLGAYHLAGVLGESLDLSADEGKLLQAAALLHDVGHGPFSHAFEELLLEDGHRHEEVSVDLLRWGPLADLLRQGGLDPVEVSDAVVGVGSTAKLVSGALDADRMDYLQRDAHYTGVRSAVDPDRLANVVSRDEEHGIVLNQRGVIAAEAMLTTRFLMYPAVYLHHTVRSSESLLQAAVQAHDEPPSAMQRCTDDELLWRMRKGGRAQELVQRLDERRLYKRAMQFDHHDYANLQQYQSIEGRRKWAQALEEEAGLAPYSVLVDIPHAPKFRELGLMVRRGSQLVPMREVSTLVNILETARMDHWHAWVFTPGTHVNAVRAVARRLDYPVAEDLP